jgi:DNA-binding CsgD family transcriptional regulator
MRLLVPHISRALGVMQRLRDADLKLAASLAALDKMPVGVLLIGRNETVVFVNRAAQRVLQREDGLRLRATGGSTQTLLAASNSADQQALNAAIRQRIQPNVVDVPHFSSAVRIERPSGAPAYTLNFSALPEQNEFGSGADRPCAIGFLNDPEEPVKVDAEALKRLYGLTAAECRLAANLCDGETLAAVAKRLRVSESTVKTQLQSIFDKTQTRRQVQLVKLLIGLASPVS